jgi:hypothetical protein
MPAVGSGRAPDWAWDAGAILAGDLKGPRPASS